MSRIRLFKLILLISINAGYGIGAASAQISVRTALSDDRQAIPGSTYEGAILIKNETDTFQQAKVYQTDYLFYSDGSNIYGEPGHDERSNAAWTEVSTSVLTLPPGETLPVSYLVHVPEQSEENPLVGSYWSMIMVEAVPEQSPESTIDPDSTEPQYGVLQIMRYGVQIATHISGTGESTLNMSDTGLLKMEDGVTALALSVENSGSLMVRPKLWVELYDDSGQAFGRHDGVQSRIYPGTSVRQKIILGELAPGSYRALVILDAGAEEVYGAEYTLNVN